MAFIRTACVLVAMSCLASACAPAPSDVVTLDGVEVSVLIADDDAERSRGLQGYDPLAEGEGMLFVFDDVAPRTFAMKEVAFPIDVVFIAEDLTVSAIEPLDPGDDRLVPSPGAAAFVVELPQGWAKDKGIGVGDAFERSE